MWSELGVDHGGRRCVSRRPSDVRRIRSLIQSTRQPLRVRDRMQGAVGHRPHQLTEILHAQVGAHPDESKGMPWHAGLGGGLPSTSTTNGSTTATVVDWRAPQAKTRSNDAPVGRRNGASERMALVRTVVDPAVAGPSPCSRTFPGNASTSELGDVTVPVIPTATMSSVVLAFTFHPTRCRSRVG